MSETAGEAARSQAGGASDAAQRLDKWLWFARIVKSRTLAAEMVAQGKVRLNRVRVVKPSHVVRPGDVLTIAMRGHVQVLRIAAAGLRRGPSPEARRLYEDLSSPAPNAKAGGTGQRPLGQGRPTKRDRRDIDRLKEEE